MGRKCGILAGKPRRVTRCRGAWTGGRSGTGRLLESLAANPGPARARNRARRTATPCKRAKRIVITIVLIVAILPMFLLFWLMSGDDENFATIDHGQSYGNSIYKRYQDAVYAAVPSNGYYRIDAADPASFQAFDTGAFDGRQAGRDQRHVYCGNLILPDLRPASARYLGNSYFSDGAATYFCSMHSRLNRELEPLDEFWQKILHRAGAGPKPQTYLYPYVALPASARPIGRCWTATWPPTARARSIGAWRCPRRTPPRSGACRRAGMATCGPAMISSPMGAASISTSSRCRCRTIPRCTPSWWATCTGSPICATRATAWCTWARSPSTPRMRRTG